MASGAPGGLTVWLTGLPASGKTTVATGLAASLGGHSRPVVVLDGDVLRAGVSRDLDFSAAGRAEAVRRAGEAALIAALGGSIAIAALVSPSAPARRRVRRLHESAGIGFLEVWLSTPLSVCEQRDPKGLYRRARLGEVDNLTGVQSPYEAPTDPEVTLPTHVMTVEEAVDLVLASLWRAIGPARP